MMLIETLTVSPFMENCYILACDKTKEAVVIDAGDEGERILSFAARKGFTIKYLINTHGHVDHMSGVGLIQERLEIPFYLHEKDRFLLDHLVTTQRMYGFGDGRVPEMTPIDPTKEYTFGEVSLRVIETPGHTPGGVCFLRGKDLFVGDTLFAQSIGRTDLPGGSMHQLLDSIRSQLLVLEDDIRVHSGHGPNTTIGNERRMNPFLV